MHKLSVLEMNRLSPEEYRRAAKTPLVVVLDDVRSMYNVGSVFRTADGFRVERLCLCGITGRPPHPEIHKTALGAEDTVEWTHHASALECVEQLRQEGYVIVAVEQVEGSVSMLEWDERRPTALVLGTEVRGGSQAVVAAADYCHEKPQLGTKHSFNVSCTAAMVMWQYFSRQQTR